MEGEYVERSLAAEIVYYADHAFWGLKELLIFIGSILFGFLIVPAAYHIALLYG